MVSEGRKAAGFHCSSFTGSQGQAFLLVWLGGELFLKGQGGGDTQPHQAPGSSPAASPSGSQSGPGNPSKEDRLVPHSTWPGRTHLPPRKQPPSETQRKRLTVPGLAFRAALSPCLRSPPIYNGRLSLPSRHLLLRPHSTPGQRAVWQGLPVCLLLSLCPQLPLGQL